MTVRTGIGQDSHRFLAEDSTKPCVIAGLIFDDVPGFKANSDGDVVFHAICNAISSLTGVIILGDIADKILEQKGITDSRMYLEEALKTLGKQQVVHVALTLEGARPKFLNRIPAMRHKVAEVMKLDAAQVGITATTGEGLTDFGCGEGIQCICILTAQDALDGSGLGG